MNDAWSKISPHQPLKPGAPQYAKRTDGGGAEMAEMVRAGWRRIAVVGPMGVGKSTELAAAQQSLQSDRIAFRIGIDHTFDMRRIEAGAVFDHILTQFINTQPNPRFSRSSFEHTLLDPDSRHARRDGARKALRVTGKAALLVDGLEKAEESAARAIAEELFALSDDADIIIVAPVAFAYGPGAAILGEDVRLFPIRAVRTWGPRSPDAVHGRLFLREIALRHLERERLSAEGPDAELLEIVDRASIASGGIPRVLLQLLRDTYRHALVARHKSPELTDLEKAKIEHGEQLRRSLLPGDIDELRRAEGQDGSEIQLERKLRFILHGLLLEYKIGDRIVMHTAPTLAQVLRFPQEFE